MTTKPSEGVSESAKPATAHEPHAWHGEGVEPAGAGTETAEAAAARAEGNAPLSVEAAEAADRAGDPSDHAEHKHPHPDDSAENLKEKQQAAREAHAEAPRHGPHGKL
jgi:hypothetical protein